MKNSDLRAKLCSRARMCRNLASTAGDADTAAALVAIAEASERELRELDSQPDDKI